MLKKILIGAGVLLLIAIGAVFGVYSHYSSLSKACVNSKGPGAIEACTKLLAHVTAPERRAACLMQRSVHYSDAGKEAESIADLKEITALPAGVPPKIQRGAYELLAYDLNETGDLQGALKYAELAISAGSEKPELYLIKAELLGPVQFAAALEALTKAESLGLKADTSSVKARADSVRAEAYMGLGQYDKAYPFIKEMEPLVKQGSNTDMRLHEKLGITCFNLKLYPEAKAAYEYLIAKGQNSPAYDQALAEINAKLAPPRRRSTKRARRR